MIIICVAAAPVSSTAFVRVQYIRHGSDRPTVSTHSHTSVHERASKEWASRGTCTHTHDFTLFDERIAPGLSAVTPRRSHSPGASAVARRVSKAPSRPPFPLALYTQSVPVCLHSINLLLSLAVGAAAVISAAFVVFGLIDAFVPNSFFLPCLDRRRGHAQTGAADLHAGQLPVEGQVPPLLSSIAELRRALLSKAAVPAHAQRMTFLLSADREFASCRSRNWGACNGGRGARAGRRERGCEAAATACTLGARLKAWGPRARAESARRTCRACL